MDILKLYDNLTIRSLIQLIPTFGGIVDLNAMNQIEAAKKKRLKIFFDKIGSSEIKLTEELIQNESYLFNYVNTVKAVVNTRRIEKITFFSNLFIYGTNNYKIFETDEYDEFLKIIDELSFTEIELLFEFKKLEDEQPINDGKNTRYDKLRRNIEFFSSFGTKFTEKCNFDRYDLDSVFIRIERTGCFYIPRKAYNDYQPNSGCTTHIFDKIYNIILDRKSEKQDQ